jgi:Skp family chaperone for outer membrane proteins
VPRKTIFKIGLATAAAAVVAILAITSALAHGTPTTTGRSMAATIVNAATRAGFVDFNDPAPVTAEEDQDAIDAAKLAAKIAAEQQQEAAELAAQQAKIAAEKAAEAAEATETDEDASEVEQADTEQADTQDVEQQTTTSGDHESGD